MHKFSRLTEVFYDRFKQLCDAKGISVTRATEEIGLARTIGTKWNFTYHLVTHNKVTRNPLPKQGAFFIPESCCIQQC